MACRPGGPWFCVDGAEGKGIHRLTSRLHLPPEIGVQQTTPDTVRIACGDTVLHWRALGLGKTEVTSGWHCREFGRRLAAPVIEYTVTCALPAVCGWCLTFEPSTGRASLERGDLGEPLLRWTEGQERWEFPPLQGKSTS